VFHVCEEILERDFALLALCKGWCWILRIIVMLSTYMTAYTYLYTGTQSLSHILDPYRYESEKLNNGFYLEQYHMTESDGILHDP
jgi:hypothetical protein